MTDFMTSFPVIFVQLTLPRDQGAWKISESPDVLRRRISKRGGGEKTDELSVYSHTGCESAYQSERCLTDHRVCGLTKGIQFQSTCSLCRESHKTQVWLCFLVLSFLSMSTCAASKGDTEKLQICLSKIKHTVEKSDAMLYAPSVDNITANCESASLKCYIEELLMVLDEEEVMDGKVQCIHNFTKDRDFSFEGCLPCEAYSPENITIFLDRLNTLLEKMTSQDNV